MLKVFKTIEATPWHAYQILTKRPGRMLWWAKKYGWPDNAWAGVSLESNYDEQGRSLWARLRLLMQIPATVRFVSVEPLLDYMTLDHDFADGFEEQVGDYIHWVIIGGESGPKFRAMPMGAFYQLVSDCKAFHIPVYVKQDSGLYPGRQGRIPDELWIKEMPK